MVVRLNINIRLQTMGWNYWYNWTIVLPAELSAAAVLIDFWDKNTNVNSAWVTICLAVVVAINFMGAGKSCEITASLKRHNQSIGVLKAHMARPNSSLLQSRLSPSPVWLFCRPIPTLSACSGTHRLDYFGYHPRPRGRSRS